MSGISEKEMTVEKRTAELKRLRAIQAYLMKQLEKISRQIEEL